jgi:hypothetical protein
LLGRGREMRVIVTILTNKNETNFAVDFYSGWPFFAFESLDEIVESEDD